MSYLLRLIDGHKWELVAVGKEAKALLKKLAAIMQLIVAPISHHTKIYFYSLNNEKLFHQKIMKFFSPDWRVRDFGTVKILDHPQEPHLIVGFDPSPNSHMEIHCLSFLLTYIYKEMINADGLPFHAGMVIKESKAYLLPAIAGTGKSTCCQRIPSPWQALADDETLIVKHGSQYWVHPLPTFSNFCRENVDQKTWAVEKAYPLAGFFFLKQAMEDGVESLRHNTTIGAVYNGAMQIFHRNLSGFPKKEITKMKLKIFNNAYNLTRTLPCHRLYFTLTGRFWNKMEVAINNYELTKNVFSSTCLKR
ncbi:SynChlorMet cassette protein ScmC [Candidatus Saganbacteria bacterium]|nr:SynChlorMet cassette protein ScmC [Candidatus Saganbacteria bacterium]